MKNKNENKSKKVPSWKLMPEVSDFENPAKMIRNLEEEIREHSDFGIPPFPEEYGFEPQYFDEEY